MLKRMQKWEGNSDEAAQEIERLRDELALIYECTTDTVYRLRYQTMQYDYISPAVERLLGYTPDELKLKGIRSLISETRIVSDRMEEVHSFTPLEESRKRGEVRQWQADYLMETKDGRRIWVSDISHPWFGEDGAVIGSVGCLRDITARVEAEERTRREIARLASIDPLTGLANRGTFFVRLEEELKRIRRSKEDATLLLIDIDYFRRINADFGHAIGDLVIREIAKLIASCLRETDLGARVGGEEFGVILPETPVSGAMWVAERIRSAVSRHIFQFDGDEHMMGLTVSIGVASARQDRPVDANALFSSADRRLYVAKKAGRDRVYVDEAADA